MLTDRQKLILSAIVDDYISSAEPVGSRSISKRGSVGFSPATIRNEMSDLEELGYLEQPHTSAGRIPSQKGYRYYVDHLVKYGQIDEYEVDWVKTFFVARIQEIEQVVQQVADILSSLTNYTSIVLGPEVFSTTLRHFQLIPLNDTTAVAIIVTNTGCVENRTVSIPMGISVSEMEKMVNLLNAKLVGVPLIQLRSKLFNEIGSHLSKHVTHYEQLIKMVENILQGNDHDRIYLGGLTNMLTQPEFKDVEKVKTILDLLEETPTLLQLINDAPTGIRVRIGAENSFEAINNCSLITATYSLGNQVLGTIGILGPTRMEYGKVISLLRYFPRDLENVLAQWYK